VPVWLLTPVFAVVFLGIVWGIYSLVHTGPSSSPAAATATPAIAPGGKANPYQQFVEVSGVRFASETKQKPVVKFVLINHSPADIQGLAGTVTVLAHTPKSDEVVGTFTFTKVDLGPFQSKDLSAPLTTKLTMVELPDWQFVKTDIQVTSPGS
jgi:hypothetical protein